MTGEIPHCNVTMDKEIKPFKNLIWKGEPTLTIY